MPRSLSPAADPGRGGEIFGLDLGEPVRLPDPARNRIRLSGLRPVVDIRIEFTGPKIFAGNGGTRAHILASLERLPRGPELARGAPGATGGAAVRATARRRARGTLPAGAAAASGAAGAWGTSPVLGKG